MSAKRVLIVDDAAVMRMMLKAILNQNGYDVVGEARSGAEALEQYRLLAPDLVTLDASMPDMDGIAALKAIVADDPGACVVVCIAMGQEGLVAEAARAGAKSFITKPYQPPTIVEAIRSVCAEGGPGDRPDHGSQ